MAGLASEKVAGNVYPSGSLIFPVCNNDMRRPWIERNINETGFREKSKLNGISQIFRGRAGPVSWLQNHASNSHSFSHLSDEFCFLSPVRVGVSVISPWRGLIIPKRMFQLFETRALSSRKRPESMNARTFHGMMLQLRISTKE
jgi:hypothetical protein